MPMISRKSYFVGNLSAMCVLTVVTTIHYPLLKVVSVAVVVFVCCGYSICGECVVMVLVDINGLFLELLKWVCEC
jgi:hypothetical protein